MTFSCKFFSASLNKVLLQSVPCTFTAMNHTYLSALQWPVSTHSSRRQTPWLSYSLELSVITIVHSIKYMIYGIK